MPTPQGYSNNLNTNILSESYGYPNSLGFP